MQTVLRSLLVLPVLLLPVTTMAAELTIGPRAEWIHQKRGHDTHISAPAAAIGRNGNSLIAWVAREGETGNLYLARHRAEDWGLIRVNPDAMAVDSLHQSPGIAVGPSDEIYVSWSSSKPKPEGVLFASDLRLSRSLDGGQTFDSHLRVNEPRTISHSFEGMAVAEDGTVFMAWIDSRDGWEKAGTYVARIGQRGTQAETIVTLDRDTCVCCRVAVATGPQEVAGILWRHVFPGNIRDMVLALSRDGGRSFPPPTLVHPDRWHITACPHRGGALGMDSQGRTFVAWYTEGPQVHPALLLAVSSDGKQFTPPRRLDESTTSIPDHVRMAVDPAGRVVILWEDATAVRRRILVRYSTDGGRTLSPVRVLSTVLKAYAPDITVSGPGEFVAVWHEGHFPLTKTVLQPLRLDGP